MHLAPYSFRSVLKKPSAFVPLLMSLTALLLVLVHVAVFGAVPEVDEGPTAHLWQILMALQFPVVLLFAVRWVPVAPRQALYVLGQQAGAALVSVGAVFLFHLG